jgi:hypothetical protein
MKTLMLSAIAALMLLAGSELCVAQGNMNVQFEKPFKVRSLSNIVLVDTSQSPISSVKVEDCTPGWKDVISSTVSDSKGRFTLQGSKANLHYLRLISPGFNITLVKTQVTRWSRRKYLNLEMTGGT